MANTINKRNTFAVILLLFHFSVLLYGAEKNKEDFGQTLAYWGIGQGPYIVLPFFGPSTFRDAPGLSIDHSINKSISPIHTELHHEERDMFSIVEVVDIRSNLLRATQILDTAAQDKYIFIRESYLQQREKLVNDGKNTEEFEIDVQSIDY